MERKFFMFRSPSKKISAVLVLTALITALSSCSPVSDQSGSTVSKSATNQIDSSDLSVSDATSSDTAVSSKNVSSGNSSSDSSAKPASGSLTDDWNLILVNLDHPLCQDR